MAGLTCPNCNAVASPAEIAAGWCDSCGKKIPASYAAAAMTPKQNARQAYLSHTPKTVRGRKRILGTLIGTLLGVLVSGILMIWPLRRSTFDDILLPRCYSSRSSWRR